VVSAVRAAGLPNAVLVMRSENVSDENLISNADLAQRVVQLDELASRYREIIDWFDPLDPLGGGLGLSPAESFVARILLIATYRRVVLADPVLPAELLPDGWSGREAYTLVARVYDLLQPASERWIVEVCDTPDGPPAASGSDSRGNRFHR
jgi:phenylacetic acid degradation operon negative regulatory protein